MERSLPTFRYHPDPVATGSIERRDGAVCGCCGEHTGWAYVPTARGEDDPPEDLCPWCIADGRAAAEFGVSFVGDTDGAVPPEVFEELERRTPSYVSWQGEVWLTHCDDAAAYRGPVGWDRLKDLPDAQESLRSKGWDDDDQRSIRPDGGLAGYLFQCLHCGTHLAGVDLA